MTCTITSSETRRHFLGMIFVVHILKKGGTNVIKTIAEMMIVTLDLGYSIQLSVDYI